MTTGFELTVDCADPRALAAFWAAALGYEAERPPQGARTWEEWLEQAGVPEAEWGDGASIVDPTGRRPRIYFQRVPEPKAGKNRLHLDLDVTAGREVPLEQRRVEVDREARRLVGLGARRLAGHELGDHVHVVMADPEGNEFCVR